MNLKVCSFSQKNKNTKQVVCGIGMVLCRTIWTCRIILSKLLYLLQSAWPDGEIDWWMDMMLWQTGLPGKGLQICLQLVVNNRWCLWVYVFNLTPEVTDWMRVAFPEEEREDRAGEERETERGDRWRSFRDVMSCRVDGDSPSIFGDKANQSKK